ncbi:MAG: response regulator [Caulobacteraceae bacterium]|nr:response regulator [Caulobacteraceae bacterium]
MCAGRRVLIVDDEVLIAMLLADMLEELGCTVVGPAHDLETAATMAKAGDFDWAVLDLNLDGAPAFPIAAILRERTIPFVFASGYGVAEPGSGFEAAPVIQKPFDVGELATALRRLGEAAGHGSSPV